MIFFMRVFDGSHTFLQDKMWVPHVEISTFDGKISITY